MKKILVFAFIFATTFLGGGKVSAQGQSGQDTISIDCRKYVSFYVEHYKQKNYDDALPNWREAYKHCPPTYRYSILSDGCTFMRNLIRENQNNPIYKAKLIDSLMTLYDQRVEFWPKYSVSSLNNKALDMYNYMKDDQLALLAGLTDVISQIGENTKPNIFVFQLNAAIDLYRMGMLDPESVINIYEVGVSCFNKMVGKNDVEIRNIERNLNDFESLFITSQVASCDNLISLFTPRFEANPDDIDLVKSIIRILSTTDGGMDTDLFLQAITKLHNSEPSHTSAYNLYKLHSMHNNIDSAIQYMEEAVSYEDSDDEQDGEYLYELATLVYKYNMIPKAYSYAQQAAAKNQSVAGKCYMMMGMIWGTTICDGDEINKRAPYWVAVDFMNKAKNADSSLASEANGYIKQYSVYFPQTSEAFMYDINDGDSYTVSCGGLRAVTTVRTQN